MNIGGGHRNTLELLVRETVSNHSTGSFRLKSFIEIDEGPAEATPAS